LSVALIGGGLDGGGKGDPPKKVKKDLVTVVNVF